MKNMLHRYGSCALAGLVMVVTLAKAADMPAEPPGVIVEEVAADSLAARAGLKIGDKLLTYDDKPLPSPAALRALQQNNLSNKEVVLHIIRTDRTLVLSVPSGRLGIVIRPELPRASLLLYTEGNALLEAEKFEEAILIWTQAAKTAQAGGDHEAAAWLLSQVAAGYETQKKWTEAREAYLAGLKLLDGSRDLAAQSQILDSLGQCSRNLNDYPDARQWYEKASKINIAAGYEIWAVANILELGGLAFSHRDYKAAVDYYRRALTIRERLTPDSLEVAFILNNLGSSDSANGDLQAAQEHHQRALAIRERLAPDSLDLSYSLSNVGGVAYVKGDLRLAAQYHRRALAIRERLAPNSLEVATSFSNLGDIAFARGDLPTAQENYRLALTIREQKAPNSLDLAASLFNVGNIAASRSDRQTAEFYYKRALEIFERLVPGSLEVATLLSNWGNLAHAVRDMDAAQEYHLRALAIRERLEPDSMGVAASINSLGDVAYSRGDLPKAEENYLRALEIRERLAPNSLEVSYSLNNLGSLAGSRGNLRAAQDYVRRGLAIRERLAPNSMSVAGSLNVLGYLALRERQFPEALDLFQKSVAIVEAQRSGVFSPEVRALLSATSTQPYAGLMSAQLGVNDLSSAFATVERIRARSLAELLSERRIDIRKEASPEIQKQQDSLDEKRSEAFAKLARLDPKKDGSQIEQLRQQLATYFVQQRELEEQIRRDCPKCAALQYQQPLDLKGAQAVLDEGTLLLTYYVDYVNTFLFAITKTDIKVFTLPIGEDELNSQVLRFRNKIAIRRIGQNDPARLKEANEDGKKLYDSLIRPAQELVSKARSILICPDGPLHVLPFAALVSKAEPDLRYFIEDKPFHSTVSMTVFAETRKLTTGNRPLGTKLLAFGDPVYLKQLALKPESAETTLEGTQRKNSEAEGDLEVAYLRGRGLDLNPLKWTRKEVEGIGRLFGTSATIQLGQDATETIAKQTGKNYSILHFAVHGWLDDQIGLNSALALSQPDVLGRKPTKEDNGLLQAWEIFEQVRFNADLVVLSACETGLGQRLRGEGLIGLTRAFQYAGAKSIVVSLWEVDDESTAILMTAFYQEFLKGVGKDVALQKAILTVRHKHQWRHPFYWSTFILVGDSQ